MRYKTAAKKNEEVWTLKKSIWSPRRVCTYWRWLCWSTCHSPSRRRARGVVCTSRRRASSSREPASMACSFCIATTRPAQSSSPLRAAVGRASDLGRRRHAAVAAYASVSFVAASRRRRKHASRHHVEPPPAACMSSRSALVAWLQYCDLTKGSNKKLTGNFMHASDH